MLIATPATSTQQQRTDADLVTASRSGDREAFAQIVRRYQGMVSGLIYAACGDLHRSEDLAQETFLSAWKSLSGLREPEKLPAWLCQIARHRAQDQQRRNTTEKVGVGGFWARQHDARVSSPTPDEELIRKEEEAVLWRALAEMPQPYRETLVLYYRQGQSTDEVAAAMETSEGAVRQRLSRGREMLRAELVEVIERNLTRSAPSPAFAMAVVAALPTILPKAGKAAGVGSALKGSLGAGSSWLGALTAWLGPLGGLASGVTGSRMALQDDHTPDERRLTVRFLIKLWLLAPVIAIGCLLVVRLHWQLHWGDEIFIPILAAFFALTWSAQSWLMLTYQSRSNAIREPGRPLPKIPLVPSLIVSGGSAISLLGWMIHFSLGAGDYLATALIIAAFAIMTPINAAIFAPRPRRLVPTLTFTLIPAITAFLNWRLNAWIAISRGVEASQLHLPLWSINLAAAVMIVWVAVLYRICYPPTGPRPGRLSPS